jgi:hypothetical protein
VIIDKRSERNDRIAIVTEILEVRLEKGDWSGHAVTGRRPKTVVEKNGDRWVLRFTEGRWKPEEEKKNETQPTLHKIIRLAIVVP